MTFLQPLLLYALPLALVPVIVHLLNKRRHRTIKWAAMMFLVRATQQARGTRKLRHFLILACRVLALAALVFLLSRPLAGGWMAWAGGNRPEAILLLLDRSPSMEARITEQGETKRELAVARLQAAINEFAGGTRVVLIDSAGGPPLDLIGAQALADLPQTGPSGAAADVPALVERALDYLATNQPGRSEIWLASDLQESNWKPADGRWQSVRQAYKQLGQDHPVRVLALSDQPPASHSLQLLGVRREGGELFLDLEIQRRGNAPSELPMALTLDSGLTTTEVITSNQPLLGLRHRIDLGDRAEAGWGRLALPPDLTPGDNEVWFAFGEPGSRLVSIVAEDPQIRVLSLAGAPPGVEGRRVETVSPAEAHRVNWDETHLLIWQAPAPDATIDGQIRAFVESGGSLLALPYEAPDAGSGTLLGMRRAAIEEAPPDAFFPITSWETGSGVLAHFRDGRPMALDRLSIIRRRLVDGEGVVLASYADGSPAFVSARAGMGEAVFATTLPDLRWSDFGRYNDLLPIVERLLDSAARYRGDALNLATRQITRGGVGDAAWETVSAAAGQGEPGAHAGIFRRGPVLAAANPESEEYMPAAAERAVVEALFEGMNMRLFEERVAREQNLITEIWRSFAIAMVLFLLVEAALSVPSRRRPPGIAPQQSTPATA